jgi:hypothetical protein
MKRYQLYNVHGALIGEADTAQGIGDIAQHKTYSLDSNLKVTFPYTSWERINVGMLGTPHRFRIDAMNAIMKLP